MSTAADLLKRYEKLENEIKALKKQLQDLESEHFKVGHTVLHCDETGYYATLQGWLSAGTSIETINAMEVTDLTNDEALLKNAENARRNKGNS